MERERRLAEVELSRRTVEEAVRDGLSELGLSSVDEAEVTVVSEGKPGFLGIGREMAVVVMRPKPKQKTRRRRRRRRGSGGQAPSGGESSRGGDKSSRDKPSRDKPSRDKASRDKASRDKPSRGNASKDKGSREPKGSSKQDSQGRSSPSSDRSPSTGSSERTQRGGGTRTRESQVVNTERPEQADIETQAEVARAFLEGLVDAFGLEADVTSRIDDDILYLDVAGEQSEALVGQKGAVLDSVLELTRTVIQRKTFGAPRMRLDIAGYTERRREALRIYAGKLAERVKETGGEVMLEPMNPADRKVVHDAIAEIDGVRSFSEGEDPDRAVVVAADEG